MKRGQQGDDGQTGLPHVLWALEKNASWTVTRALTIREASHGYGRVHTEVVELEKRQRPSVAEAARRLDAHAKLPRQ